MSDKDIQAATSANRAVSKIQAWGKRHFVAIFNVAIFAALVIYLCCTVSINPNRPTWELVTDIAYRFVITMTYWSTMYYSGSQRGRETDTYKAASLFLQSIIDAIRAAKKLGDVDAFCAEYVKAELETYRCGLVESVGIDYENEYLKVYQQCSIRAIMKMKDRAVKSEDGNVLRFSKQQKKMVILALQAKPKKLTYTMLIGGRDAGRRKGLVSPNETALTRRRATTKVLLFFASAAITAAWSASFGIKAASAIGTIATMSVVILCSAILGWVAGFKNTSVGAVVNYNDRADLLTIMCEKHNIKM